MRAKTSSGGASGYGSSAPSSARLPLAAVILPSATTVTLMVSGSRGILAAEADGAVGTIDTVRAPYVASELDSEPSRSNPARDSHFSAVFVASVLDGTAGSGSPGGWPGTVVGMDGDPPG